MKLLHHYTQNTNGRDFVCGDLHGCYDQLMEILAQVNFDDETDRVFCVGDLVDRGGKSLETLHLIKKPWFKSVLGNHEVLMMGALTTPTCEQDYHERASMWKIWTAHGGDWFMQLSDQQEMELYRFIDTHVRHLPLVITIDINGKKVGIVHAQITSHWDNIVDDLTRVDTTDIFTINNNPLVAEMLWARNKVTSLTDWYEYSIQGIDHIFHGHTIQRSGNIKTIQNCSYIDTGCFLRDTKHNGRLTVIEISKFLNDASSGIHQI